MYRHKKGKYFQYICAELKKKRIKPTSHIRTIGPGVCPAGVFYGHRCRCRCRCRRCSSSSCPRSFPLSTPQRHPPGQPPTRWRQSVHLCTLILCIQDIAGSFACTHFRIWASLLLFVHFLSGCSFAGHGGQWWPWSFVLERYRYIFLYILFFTRARMQ